jgi:hypothetical protein
MSISRDSVANDPHETEEDIDNKAGFGEDSSTFRERKASSLAKELEKATQQRVKLEALLREKVEAEKKEQKGKRKFNTSAHEEKVATRGKSMSSKLKDALDLEKESDEEREAKKAKMAAEKKTVKEGAETD